MAEASNVVLIVIVVCIFTCCVCVDCASINKRFFHAKKQKRTRNTELNATQTTAPADNTLPMREIQCEVCGYKFIPYNDNRYTVVGEHNYGRFHYYNDGAIISDTAIVDGLHDAFSCPMCGCQIVVHPHLPIYEER
ncbi:hypothetical protein [Gemmiger sp.]